MSDSIYSLIRPGVSVVLAQCLLHLKLFHVEWQVEKLRFRNLLVMLLLGIAMFICSLLAISTLIILLSWNTEFRVLSVTFLAIFFSLGTAIVGIRINTLLAMGADSFADSRRELGAEFQLLQRRLKQ